MTLNTTVGDADSTKKYAIALSVVALLVFYLLRVYGLAVYDEGFLVTGSLDILDGKIIYKDFFKEYAPGNFFTLSLLFDLFGKNILVERTFFVAVRAATVLMLFLTSRLFIKGRIALLPPLIFLLVPGPWHKSYVPFFTVIDIYFLCRFLRAMSFARLCGLGLLTATTLFFRQDVGIFFILTVLLSIALARPGMGRPAPSPTFPMAGIYLLSTVVFFLPVLAYFYHKDALGAFINDCFLVSWAVRGQTGFPFPYPTLVPYKYGVSGIFYYLPAVVCIMFSLYILIRREDKERFYMLPVVLMGLMGFVNIYKAPDHSHLVQYAAPAYVLGAVGISKVYDKVRILIKGGLAGALFGGVSTVALSSIPAYFVMSFMFSPLGTNIYSPTPMLLCSDARKLDNPRAPVLLPVKEADELEGVTGFIQANFKKDEAVLVVPPSYILNFLADRPAYYSSDFFFTGEFLGAQEKEDLIKMMSVAGPEYVIVDKRRLFLPDNLQKWVYLRKFKENYPEMYSYLTRNYSAYRVFGIYLVLKRGITEPSAVFYEGVDYLNGHDRERALLRFREAEKLGLPDGLVDYNRIFSESDLTRYKIR